MTRFDTALFDLDGTLLDGRAGIVRSLRHALRRYDIEPEAYDLSAFIGPPLHEVFAEGFGLPRADVAGAVDTYREYYGDRGLFEAEIYAGIPELLSDLCEAGSRLAVATSKPHVYARRILDHFGLLARFDAVCGPELDGTRRHKHEVIEHALARLDHPARETAVMVGDRSYDVAGARRTGLSAVSVGWGFGSAEELARAEADHHTPTVDALGEWLRPRGESS